MSEDRARLWSDVVAHRERLLRIARARTATAQDAEDCVQEAMLRCMEFDNLDESRLGPFLTTVTIRLCADRYRESANDERLRRRLGFREREAPGHEDEICDRGEAAWLAREFAGLTPRQQEIVRARETGLSCAEVASRLQVSYGAVESSLARARSRFRDTLAKSMGGLSPLALRWTTVCAEVATAAAVVVGGGGMVAAAAPPAIPVTPTPVAPRVVSRPQPTSRPPVRAAAPVVTAKPRPAPARPTVGIYPDTSGYDTRDRVMHCVTEAVRTMPIQCRYPDEAQSEPPGLP